MITEKELIEAIEECEQDPITLSKIGKLADFYIVYDRLFGQKEDAFYSYKTNAEETIRTNSGTEFLRAINGKSSEKVLAIVDELADAVKTLHPRMYDSLIEKLYNL